MGAMFMKPSGRSSYAGLLPAGRKKVELLIISALLQLCHRSSTSEAAEPSTTHRVFFLFFAFLLVSFKIKS